MEIEKTKVICRCRILLNFLYRYRYSVFFPSIIFEVDIATKQEKLIRRLLHVGCEYFRYTKEARVTNWFRLEEVNMINPIRCKCFRFLSSLQIRNL